MVTDHFVLICIISHALTPLIFLFQQLTRQYLPIFKTRRGEAKDCSYNALT